MMSKTTTVVTKATSKLQIKPEEAPIPTDLLNEILLVSCILLEIRDNYKHASREKKGNCIHWIVSGEYYGYGQLCHHHSVYRFSRYPSRVKGILGRVIKLAGYVHHYKSLPGQGTFLIPAYKGWGYSLLHCLGGSGGHIACGCSKA